MAKVCLGIIYIKITDVFELQDIKSGHKTLFHKDKKPKSLPVIELFEYTNF